MASKRQVKSRGMVPVPVTGFPTEVYYPKLLHFQTAYAALGYKVGDFPVTEDAAKRIVSLPMGPYVRDEDQLRVVEAILKEIGGMRADRSFVPISNSLLNVTSDNPL